MKQARRTTVLGLVAFVAFAVTGCGGSNKDHDQPALTPALAAAVEEGEITEDGQLTAIGAQTVAIARLNFTRTILDGSHYRATRNGVEDIIRLCRAAPDAVYEPHEGTPLTLRQIVEDSAAELRPYQGDLAARLQSVADGGCG